MNSCSPAVALLLAGCAAAPAARPPAASPGPRGDGAIAGRVTLAGPIPPPERIALTGGEACAEAHPGGLLELQPFRVEDGGLADAVVHVVTPPAGSYPPPADAQLLDQVGCRYEPPVLALLVGQPLIVRNSDRTLHNVHGRPRRNEEFNQSEPARGMEITRIFDRAETAIPIGCDVHPWMRAHVSAFSHPFFAVSGEGGIFAIEGLPPGTYEVEALHAALPPVRGTATVAAAGAPPARLDLALARP